MKEQYEAYCEAYRRKGAAECSITDFFNFDQLTEKSVFKILSDPSGAYDGYGNSGNFSRTCDWADKF